MKKTIKQGLLAIATLALAAAEAPVAGGNREKVSSEAPELPQTGDSSVYLLAAGAGSIILLVGMGLLKKQS